MTAESPYMGWIVPHAWQEPADGEDDLMVAYYCDQEPEQPEDWSDYDPGDELSVKMWSDYH